MRKICIVTSTRAEYGLLEPLIKQIPMDSSLELQLIVTGTHLSKEFGETYKQITYPITKRINIHISWGKEDIPKSMGIAQIKFAKTFSKLKPDIIILLGDRYEIFAVAATATTLNIPIAHIHGGELTFGAIDDSFRHCITKMSHIHFTSTKEYKKRVIQLGESPKTVFNVGSLGIENIKSLPLLNKKELEKTLKFNFLEKNILITFHPETISNLKPKEQIKEVLDSLSTLENTLLIFTKSNADFGGFDINNEIDKYVLRNNNSIVFTSMGQLNYFSTLQFVDCVLGNSSSGLIEVPSFKIPTINIGRRQEGRVCAKSIINTKLKKTEIIKAIKTSYSKSFRKSILVLNNPYEKNNTSKRIIKKLKELKLKNILKKKFYDL